MTLAVLQTETDFNIMPTSHPKDMSLDQTIAKASSVIAPVWSLKTFIACNPLQGYEDQPFEQALAKATALRKTVSANKSKTDIVNRVVIKWLSIFLDEGQATIEMPGREQGFFATFLDLVRFDPLARKKKAFIHSLPLQANSCIVFCLTKLGVAEEHYDSYFRQAFGALPGWTGYIKGLTEWHGKSSEQPITLGDYLAVRLVIACLLDTSFTPEVNTTPISFMPKEMESRENTYRHDLINKISGAHVKKSVMSKRSEAQMVFCIDVRSEPFRRAIEAQGNYETFGFAGFFGLPVRINDDRSGQAYDSCPVLLKPSYDIHEHAGCCGHTHAPQNSPVDSILEWSRKFYRALKYNFTTPFALVEMLGPWWGMRMLLRTFFPVQAEEVKQAFNDSNQSSTIDIAGIPQTDQANFAEGALRMMGLTDNFAPAIVFCGHGSTTTNNAYASALDCGACGGNHGGANARALAAMLNKDYVRQELGKRGLSIPKDTRFLAAEHDTTTDELKFYDLGSEVNQSQIAKLLSDCKAARTTNNQNRCKTFGLNIEGEKAESHVSERSLSWAETRPEWGLARNAAFIVGHRDLTKKIDLKGRCFLHSYDWQADKDGKFLETILTAPMVVAQWINNQYLFSTYDNVNYGSGSKVTQNVTGKIGIMQGNASDLMHGLSLQSVSAEDDKPYHEVMRLLTIVHAPKARIKAMVDKHEILQRLFGNGWVTLACLDPSTGEYLILGRDLSWQKQH